MYTQKVKKGRNRIQTTISDEHREYLISQNISISDFLAKAIDLIGSIGDFESFRDLQKRVKFFGTKVVELQAELSFVKKENTSLKLKVASLDRKLKKYSKEFAEKGVV